MQSGHGVRNGCEFSPGAAFPVGAVAYDRRVAASRVIFLVILDVVTDRRLVTATPPGWAVIVHWSSAVHHIGESLDLVEESFALEVMRQEHLVVPVIVTWYVSHLLIKLAWTQ
jgi:hypothetical protein